MSEKFSGRFEDWVPLGEGAEGNLYRVRDRWTGQMVALKLAGPGSADAVLREYRLLSFLRHPCLIESTDLVRDPAEIGHLLEFVPAVDPRSLWDEGGEEAVWAALVQALRGIEYLHRRGYVHGDVAPGNILVWRDGERWRAKVADLGLTMAAGEALGPGVRGTPGYMAPEAARGEGQVSSSDYYALAATAVCWIDGRGPWEGAAPADQLKRIAAGEEVPRPSRRISPELENLIVALGNPEPGRRGPGDWTELRENQERWGPPTLRATVVGLDDTLARWRAWLDGIPVGQVASIGVRGRVGTGRKTLCRTFARSLVATGWTALWDLPLDALRDWLESVEGDPDPVQLARELGARFGDRDVVVLWPERIGEVEHRLLQAFLTAREDEGGKRTLVLQVLGEGEGMVSEQWLTRTRIEDWSGDVDMKSIRDDLFRMEESLRDRLAGDSHTPMSMELAKLASLGGYSRSDLDQAVHVLEHDVQQTWDAARPESQEALALLAWSDSAWSGGDLAQALGWSKNTERSVLTELQSTQLTTRHFEGNVSLHSVSDWVIRDSLVRKKPDSFSQKRLYEVSRRLDVHPGDLSLALMFLNYGIPLVDYTRHSLDVALGKGRYNEVLEFRSVWERSDGNGALQDQFLRAAQRLGKYAEQVEILTKLLTSAQGSLDEIDVRKQLAISLAHMGNWRDAVRQCKTIRDLPGLTAEDAVWALLQEAETLWQAGLFAEADEIYERAKSSIGDGMESAWLRYFVGRARQYGQRGDIDSGAKYLEQAASRLGSSHCEEDILYLLTLGGIQLERARGLNARSTLQRAMKLANEVGDWNAYMMILARSSATLNALGEVGEANRLDREGLATALALGSDRIAGRLHGYLAFSETLIGHLSSAIKRLEVYLHMAESLDDLNMQIQAHQFYCHIASQVGWHDMFLEAMAKLEMLADRVGHTDAIVEARRYLGIYEMGAGHLDKAIQYFKEDLRNVRSFGRLDSEVDVRIRDLVASFRIGQGQNIEGEMQDIIDTVNDQQLSKLTPIVELMKAELGEQLDQESAAMNSIRTLWEKRRILDVYEWVPQVVCKLDNPSDAKRILLSAVERILNSIDDAQLRKQFLGFPKTVTALRVLKN